MLISSYGNVKIYQMAYRAENGAIVEEWYVYEGEKLVRVCPSIGMANEVAAGL